MIINSFRCRNSKWPQAFTSSASNSHELHTIKQELDPQQKVRYQLFLDSPTPYQQPFQQSPKPANSPQLVDFSITSQKKSKKNEFKNKLAEYMFSTHIQLGFTIKPPHHN